MITLLSKEVACEQLARLGAPNVKFGWRKGEDLELRYQDGENDGSRDHWDKSILTC
jgi:hypothetical protein